MSKQVKAFIAENALGVRRLTPRQRVERPRDEKLVAH
jgi:hypothetical protein